MKRLLFFLLVIVSPIVSAFDVASDYIRLSYDGFTVYYDQTVYQPRIVWYTLTADNALNDPPNKRPGTFHKDDNLSKLIGTPNVPVHGDYTNSGYDRGHLAPADDFDDDQARLNGTFVTSNISPQVPHLNQHGAWRKSELYGKELAIKYDSVTIFCGPLFYGTNHKTIGSSRKIAVPEAFFKIFVFYDEGFAHWEAYIIPNEAGTTNLNNYEVPLESIVSILRSTGITIR
jgi:endonuclease G